MTVNLCPVGHSASQQVFRELSSTDFQQAEQLMEAARKEAHALSAAAAAATASAEARTAAANSRRSILQSAVLPSLSRMQELEEREVLPHCTTDCMPLHHITSASGQMSCISLMQSCIQAEMPVPDWQVLLLM